MAELRNGDVPGLVSDGAEGSLTTIYSQNQGEAARLEKTYPVARAAVGVALVGALLSGGPARAETVLQGSIAAGTDPSPFCSVPSASPNVCGSFFLAGCPEDLAHNDGLTESIVKVTQLGGQTLKFTWGNIGTEAYDEYDKHDDDLNKQYDELNNPYFGGHPPNPAGSGELYISFTSSCDPPQGLFSAKLTTQPEGRSANIPIPTGTEWLVVKPLTGAAGVTWKAERLPG